MRQSRGKAQSLDVKQFMWEEHRRMELRYVSCRIRMDSVGYLVVGKGSRKKSCVGGAGEIQRVLPCLVTQSECFLLT